MYYFIVNEESRTGGSRKNWDAIQPVLKKKKIKYGVWFTEYKGHATILANKISSKKDDDIKIIIVGGDGTINEVINGIQDFSRVKIGIIPSGSGNDFARGLKIKGAMPQLERILASDTSEWIDLGQVIWENQSPRLFGISSGVGLDALVCKKAMNSSVKKILNKLHLGKLTYLVLTVQSLFTMDTFDMEISYDDKKTQKMQKVVFCAAMNFRAEGGGVPMAPSASAVDGELSICTVYGVPRWKAFLYLIPLVLAKHKYLKCVNITNCKSCRITTTKSAVLHSDGECCGDVKNVEMKCLHSKINVIM